MNVRIQLSILLVALAFLLVLVPGAGEYSFREKPSDLIAAVINKEPYFSVDEVARFVNAEDSTLVLIDLRTQEEYNQLNIPGAMNVPFNRFFESKPESWLYDTSKRYVFYSNDDFYSSAALTLAQGLGYSNCFAMKGGLNVWFETVMNSEFTGERISARENARFENRIKAKRFFTEINSLPDSLRLQYAESRRQAERNLDGGCE